MNHFSDKVNLIWDIADTLRGPYRPPEYRKVMLPMTVLRRLDCVLEPTKHQVLETPKKWSNKAADAPPPQSRPPEFLQHQQTRF